MIQHLAPGKIPLMNEGAHAILYLLFSALWLRCNQSKSFLVQETQSAKDLDLTCFKTFPITAVTCLQVGPMSLDWPVDPFARSDFSRLPLPPEVPSGVFQPPLVPVGGRMLFKYNRRYCPYDRMGWMWPFPFRRHAMYYLEQGPCCICFLQTKEQRAQTQISQKTL